MRYTVPTTEEKTEIEFKNKIYTVDDTLQGFLKFAEIMQNKETQIDDIICFSLGEEAYNEIIASNPKYTEIQELCITIGAAMKGISPDDLKKTMNMKR